MQALVDWLFFSAVGNELKSAISGLSRVSLLSRSQRRSAHYHLARRKRAKLVSPRRGDSHGKRAGSSCDSGFTVLVVMSV